MGVSTLSLEQIEELQSSPYVASVTARQVSFTKEFSSDFMKNTRRENLRERFCGIWE